MTKTNRLSFTLALVVLLLAVAVRMLSLDTVPLGLNAQEIIDIRLAENARQGDIQVFYNVDGQGRDALYPMMLAIITAFTGAGSLGYQMASLWFGMLAVALVYALARRLYGDLAGLCAMALLAFSFYPMLLSRLAQRETLLPALVAGVLLAATLAFPVYWRRRTATAQTTAFALLGALVGLGVYVHPAGLAVAGMVGLFTLYMVVVRRARSFALLSYIAFGGLVALILATPYIASSINLPHLGGLSRLTVGYGESDTSAPVRLLNSLIGLGFSGDSDPVYNVPRRALFDPLTLGLILVGLAAAVRSARKARYALLVFASLTLLPLAVLSPFSPSNLAFSASLPVLAILFGLGVTVVYQWIARDPARWAQFRTPLAGSLITLLILNGLWASGDLLNRWHRLPEVYAAYHSDLGQLAHHVDRTAARVPTVVCANGITQRRIQRELSRASLFTLMSNRIVSDVRFAECDTATIIINGGDQVQQTVILDANRDGFSPYVQQWLALGTPLASADLPDRSVYLLRARTELADKVGRFTTTAPFAYAPEVANSEPFGLPPPVALENNLTFLGYETPRTTFRPGDIVTVVTYWRVEGDLPRDLTLFTHIQDDPGAPPVANTDTISVIPRQMRNRDVFMQVTYIPLPETMPPRNYIVSVGAYRQQSGERLRVLAEGGREVRGNRLILYTITIESGE